MIYTPKIYTVESVNAGHPDKICDQISDAILDACLAQDAESRVAVECLGSGNLFVISGQITTSASVNFAGIAQKVYREIGYQNDLNIIQNIDYQSPDIAQGVDVGGAGDQGIMYGYATNETKEYLPIGVVFAHKLTQGLEDLRLGGIDWLLPDGKAQVMVENGFITKILISTQHKEGVDNSFIRETIINKLIRPLSDSVLDENILINPTGKFVIGGFVSDTGLTGRKIMVDTYGGLIPHGGGAFSGKDASKVDRSAAYMARFVAKNLVARGLAEKCLVSISYAIGCVDPFMVKAIDQDGNTINEVAEFDFRPKSIIERLGLSKPIYQQTASYGHFGKDGLPWEEIENDSNAYNHS